MLFQNTCAYLTQHLKNPVFLLSCPTKKRTRQQQQPPAPSRSASLTLRSLRQSLVHTHVLRLLHIQLFPTGRKSLSAASDDDDFIAEPSDSEMETKSQKSSKSVSSRSGSSRRSAVSDDDSEDEEPVKKSKSKSTAKKATSDKSVPVATSGTRSFLTAAEQREQDKKNEKKESESPYAFLAEIRDVIVSRTPLCTSHSFSCFLERWYSSRRSQIRPKNTLHPSKGLERFHSLRKTGTYPSIS